MEGYVKILEWPVGCATCPGGHVGRLPVGPVHCTVVHSSPCPARAVTVYSCTDVYRAGLAVYTSFDISLVSYLGHSNIG